MASKVIREPDLAKSLMKAGLFWFMAYTPPSELEITHWFDRLTQPLGPYTGPRESRP